ncbi:choice-of-anchor E domain-containing protein [Thermodesulfobacteriota bacterium]
MKLHKVLFVIVLLACGLCYILLGGQQGCETCTDNDGDGYALEGGSCGPIDCDDSDSRVNPGAEEICVDTIDNDCDDLIDPEDPGCGWAIVRYCEGVSDVTEESRSFPKFDPASGTLTGAEFSFEMSVDHDLFIENQGASPTSDLWIDSFFFSRFSFPGCDPDPIELEVVSHVSDIGLEAYDGVTDYDGRSGVTFHGLSAHNTGTYEPTDLVHYTGTGNFDMTISAGFSRYEYGHEGSQPDWYSDNSIDVQACVVYKYEPSVHVVVPSPDFPTIQRGIDDIADGGTIGIAPGTYHETLRIEGKQVNLVGGGVDGRSATEIVGTDGEEGTITFGADGGGTIHHLKVSGGAYGIAGERGVDELKREVLPAPIFLEDVEITQTGRGIYGNFTGLSGDGVEIHDTRWNGMSILKVRDLHMVGWKIDITAGVGILLFNYDEDSQGLFHFIGGEDCYIAGNPGGGITVVGGAKPVWILDCVVDDNGDAGIDLFDTGDILIQNSWVSNTHMRPDERFGDGVRAWSSDRVTLLYSTITHNDRAGISWWGCAPDDPTAVRLGNNAFTYNVISINGESATLQGEDCPQGSWSIDDQGGNYCADENGDPHECGVESSSLEPPPPIDEP